MILVDPSLVFGKKSTLNFVFDKNPPCLDVKFYVANHSVLVPHFNPHKGAGVKELFLYEQSEISCLHCAQRVGYLISELQLEQSLATRLVTNEMRVELDHIQRSQEGYDTDLTHWDTDEHILQNEDFVRV